MALTSKKLDQVRPTVPVALAGTPAELVRVNIAVSEATRREWKKLALERGLTLQELVINAVAAYTSERT